MDLVELQHVSTLELEEQQKELNEGYFQSQSIAEKLQKQADKLHQVRVQLAEEKVQEIDALKETQDKLQQKSTQDIMEFKKEQDRLIVENALMYAKCGEVDQAISEACQHIFQNTVDLTPVEKAKRLGKNIVQLQDNNLMLQALVQPRPPPEHVAERKVSIEYIVTKFEGME